MCCPLDQIKGKIIIQAFAIEEDRENEREILHLRTVYDRQPETLADRISRFFQRLELAEKIAEVADESFHLFSSVFQRYTNLMVYQTLRNLHHGAHEIEHVLHSFCFLGDVTLLVSGKFLKYHDHEAKIDYLRSASRVCHALAHFLASAKFLNELQLCSLGQLSKVVKYAPVMSLVGYALWTTALIWEYHQEVANDQFASEISIHLGGFLFEASLLTAKIDFFASSASYLNKTASIAGIIHAWFVVQRLMPQDREDIETQMVLPEEESDDEHSPQLSHHGHHHSHGHHLRFRAVQVLGHEQFANTP